MKVYKIRNKITGLFSTGGMEPKFNKKGKVWNGIGPLKNHLHQFDHVYHYDYDTHIGYYTDETQKVYKDCEIIEYDLETSMSIASIKDV
jgi:hypothetical protein